MFRDRTGSPRHHLAVSALAMFAAAPVAALDLVGSCGELPDKLAACEEYSCTFTHPFTGGPETRTVEGLEGDTCKYRESMPNKGAMDCAYDAATRQAMADYYRSYFETGNPPGDGNPLNDALADGICKVSGY